jgi:hypothetical protein
VPSFLLFVGILSADFSDIHLSSARLHTATLFSSAKSHQHYEVSVAVLFLFHSSTLQNDLCRIVTSSSSRQCMAGLEMVLTSSFRIFLWFSLYNLIVLYYTILYQLPCHYSHHGNTTFCIFLTPYQYFSPPKLPAFVVPGTRLQLLCITQIRCPCPPSHDRSHKIKYPSTRNCTESFSMLHPLPFPLPSCLLVPPPPPPPSCSVPCRIYM